MFSKRLRKTIAITAHARERMTARAIDDALLLDLIETGEVRHKDDVRIWFAKRYRDRTDNLLCVASVVESALAIKSVMHHFSWGSES